MMGALQVRWVLRLTQAMDAMRVVLVCYQPGRAIHHLDGPAAGFWCGAVAQGTD
jgi:hypothetical protein